MSGTKARILIVDDELSIRSTMSLTLTEIGYRVKCAEDGFSALAELRKEVPDILLSDLNMPGMSGFELLSVVRRRYHSVHRIAMSGAFSGDEMPSGVAADGFYQKGSSLTSLLRIIEAHHLADRIWCESPSASAPIWVQRCGLGTSGEEVVTIACPECLRSFPLAYNDSTSLIRETNCVHCHSLIHYAAVHLADRTPEETLPAQGRKTVSANLSQSPAY